MPQISADDIGDLVTTTLDDLGRLRWTEIATDLQEHIALPMILKEERVRFESGEGISRNIMIDHSGAARHVGMFAQDTLSVSDVMSTFRVPWRSTTSNYIFDRREAAMNATPARIVDLIRVRRADAMISLSELIESTFWSKGPDDDSDDITPFGLYYWLVSNTTSTGDFDGGNAAGFASGPGGISSATQSRWSNYTFNYAAPTQADMGRGMRQCYEYIHFKSPVDIPSYDRSQPRYQIYTTYPALMLMEELSRAQNDQLGMDFAATDGRTVFRGTPIKWVPQINSDTTHPIIFLDWAVFYPVFLSGEYLRESPARESSGSHWTMVIHVDLTWNLLCVNRRKLGIGLYSGADITA